MGVQDFDPLTDRNSDDVLVDLVGAIVRGDRDDAITMLTRFARNAREREIIERYRR